MGNKIFREYEPVELISVARDFVRLMTDALTSDRFEDSPEDVVNDLGLLALEVDTRLEEAIKIVNFLKGYAEKSEGFPGQIPEGSCDALRHYIEFRQEWARCHPGKNPKAA